MAAELDTKANRRKLRELAGVAYTRELAAELAKLEREFVHWRSGQIDPFELSDRIHRFHDGISRDLYVLYRDLLPIHAVARALGLHLLKENEIPADLLSALESAIELYRDLAGEPDTGDQA
jgi:hypothetical protein